MYINKKLNTPKHWTRSQNLPLLLWNCQ